MDVGGCWSRGYPRAVYPSGMPVRCTYPRILAGISTLATPRPSIPRATPNTGIATSTGNTLSRHSSLFWPWSVRANISTCRSHVIHIDGRICKSGGSTCPEIQTANQG